MESWQPISDTEFAFFFEDDIEVSSKYFEYSIVCLQKYILPGGRRAAPSIWNERLIGVSLTTPRFNEIILPGRDWIPQDEIGDEDAQFLFQLPSSWGALYFPWEWRAFLDYYNWRGVQPDKSLDYSIPDSATRLWKRSWKKFLIEFMYMRGTFMIYPNLPNQLSLSTHHREPGEHTRGNPEEPLVDDLGTIVLNYFTVPMITDREEGEFNRLLATMKPLRETPVVNFHHEKVPNIHSLSQLGIITVSIMEKAGWSHSKYDPNPTCLLDRVTFPVLGNNETVNMEKYLLYEPQLSFTHQLNALQNAVAVAKVLGRTLIVPPLVSPTDPSTYIPLSRVFDFQGTHPYVKTIALSRFAQEYDDWIDRIVQYVPWSLRNNPSIKGMTDSFIAQFHLIPTNEAILHAYPVTEKDIKRSYEGCADRVLSFRHLYGAFSSFTDANEDQQFKAWIADTFRPTEAIKRLLVDVKIAFGDPLICAIFSRGDVPDDCGRDIARIASPSDEQKLVEFRNCKSNVERTLEYALEDASQAKITAKSIYLITEMIDVPADLTGPKSTPLYRKQHLIDMILAREEISDIPEEMRPYVADIIETELCAGASFFMGNIYSSYSSRIIAKRDKLPTNILGKTMSS